MVFGGLARFLKETPQLAFKFHLSLIHKLEKKTNDFSPNREEFRWVK